jgi:hypothetical protein
MSWAEIAPQRAIRVGSEVGKEWGRDVTFWEVDDISSITWSGRNQLVALASLLAETSV